MKILDATCGYRGMWYIKNHPFVTFMDKRKEVIKSTHKHQKPRVHNINPDIISEWKDAPFPDNHFDMVIFDPPHMIWKRKKKESTLDKQYGYFYEGEWEKILREGIAKLFKILKPEGVFILKWCELYIPVQKIIDLCPYQPLFGTRTGQANKTHWILFLKYKLEEPLDKWIGE